MHFTITYFVHVLLSFEKHRLELLKIFVIILNNIIIIKFDKSYHDSFIGYELVMLKYEIYFYFFRLDLLLHNVQFNISHCMNHIKCIVLAI